MLTLVIAVCILSFILVSASPVDPLQAYVGAESTMSEEAREEVAEYWGLNDPPVERFLTWANNTLHGGKVLPYLKGCYFYCKGTQMRMRDLARWPMANGINQS